MHFSTTGTGSAYGYGRILEVPYGEAIAKVRTALDSEGFGVLSEIDIHEKLREKLGVDFPRYKILGACNPPIAYRSLQEEIELGLLLPCNVIVYEHEGKVVVSAVDAVKMLSVVGNPSLEAAAAEVNGKLHRVIDSL